ncbi:Caleosin related protein-domain-containing protein [Pyrenochaeta sp. MPI-SDFR-AT-0127]|nr:Caleosin related protein-domain-containing protein [Pyrenochaeta sp. MPI-SDFR-AT-0127]
MAIQVNLLSAKVSFKGNNPAISALKSAEVNQAEDHDGTSCGHSSSSSDKTLLDQDREFAFVETTSWIAGVGDICNGTSREVDLQSSPIGRQKTKNRNHSISLRTHWLGKPTLPVEPHHNQRTSNTKRSALRRHCDFWDSDQDGLIYPWDIFVGFRKLGFNIALCLWAAISMAICSSYGTQAGWLPHPLLAINLNNINCNRHGSTTGAYDMDAELDMRRFEAIFAKYAGGKDYLTWRTVYDVWRGQCCANDWFGWFAGGLEWIAMYILLWPRDGKMRKEDVLGVYDGTIFSRIAEIRLSQEQ